MSRGLVIGKFLPVHNGHVALIRFAAQYCDELIVSMSYREDDPINYALRIRWLKEIFETDSNIDVRMIKDDFDREDLPWPSRTKVWADVITKLYGNIDVLISSEEYGSFFAANLGAKNILFDPGRTAIPVSATQIRSSPFRYWDFIPENVRPYFVKKVCFYGPESTGKTEMTKRMAQHYETEFVPEVAREFLTTNDFTVEDIIKIGNAHYQRIIDKTKTANKILFVDTDSITTQIYSQYYLNSIPPVLYELESKVNFDHYFLFDIDVQWVADGLRDLGNYRSEMFNIFRDALVKRKIDFTLINGSYQDREKKVIEIIDTLLL